LHLLAQELLLDVATDVADRHAFLLERFLESFVVLEVLVLPHRGQPAIELLVAQPQALLPAQESRAAVDRATSSWGVTSASAFNCSSFQDFGLEVALAERRSAAPRLALDVSFHLDQHLLDYLRRRLPASSRSRPASASGGGHAKQARKPRIGFCFFISIT
jgi:hypothetical protein